MSSENSDEGIAEAPGEKKAKFPPRIIIAILGGVLLMVLIGGSVFHILSRKALVAELAAAKKELKRQTVLLSELQEETAKLSKQMRALKEFSVTGAYAAADANNPPPAGEQVNSAPPAAEAEVRKPEVATAPVVQKARPEEKTVTPASKPPAAHAEAETVKPAPALAAKKTAPGVQDCQLLGKSPEEQSATLQRCMQAVDGKSNRR